ncbi:TIGR04255 family protein, partial [bacterium]
RASYPILRQEHALVVNAAGGTPIQHTAWRFNDVEGQWRVSLTPEFVTLETTKYTSRRDLLDRLCAVVKALVTHIDPKVMDRLGVRYIDRVVGAPVEDIARFVRAEVLGIGATKAFGHVQHAVTEALFDASGDAQVLARWGRIPPGLTVDPAAIEPTSDVSWILDLDMFSTAPKPFDVESIVGEAGRFAERLYTVFRWAVTDDFLRHYGGDL